MTVVVSWAREAVDRLTADPLLEFEAVHLDQLMGAAWKKPDAVQLGHNVYDELLGVIQPHAHIFQTSLVFALNFSAQMIAEPPALNALEAQLRQAEPPSLYLIPRRQPTRWSDWEEYRVPIEQDIHHPAAGGVRAHYSCKRGEEDRVRGWEFARAVYFDHFTDDLL